MTKTSLARVCCLIVVGAWTLSGCGKGDPKKGKAGKGSSPTSAVMGSGGMGGGAMSGGMGASDPVGKRPAPRPVPAASVGTRAGVKVWPPKWTKELKPHYKQFKKASKKKEWAKALAALGQMNKLQPALLDVIYKLAYTKALSGDAKGALAHLQVLLLAHYPKYSFKVATDKDLDSLKKAPHKAKLDALIEDARVEHVAAWKKAAFFVGANLRAFKYKRSIRGSQEIFGYVPETGRYVGVTYVDSANAVGYLVTPDRKAMIYVAASQFVSAEGPARFRDVEVHVLSLVSGKRLKVFSAASHPGGGFHGQARAADDTAKPKEPTEDDAGVVDIKLEQLKSGVYRLVLDHGEIVTEMADKVQTFHFRIDNDALADVADPPTGNKARVVNNLRVRMCGAKAKRLTWARKIKKDGDTFELGGQAVKFACAGLIWRSPDRARAVFQPFRYCRKHPSKLDGLYVVDAAGKFTRVTPKHDTWDLKWIAAHRALVQFGGQVAYVDAKQPSFTLLAPLAGHLRAFGPRAIPKCPD